VSEFEIRILGDSQIEDVYETHMRRDFPRDELKPLHAIMEMKDRGIYDCLGLFDGTELLAYAYLVKERARGYLLLDYLAACPDRRSQGVGSRTLSMLRDRYREKKGIFIECECLRTSADDAQLQKRQRRENFYERNGCVKTDVNSGVYGVEYDVLYLPLQESHPRYEKELDGLYHEMFSEKARKDHVRIWV